MRPLRFELTGHRSVEEVVFEASQLNILFGKNNVGKTNILEAAYGTLTGERIDHRRSVISRNSRPGGGLWVELEPGLDFDDKVISALTDEGLGASHRYARLGPRGVQAGDPEAPAPEPPGHTAWEENGSPDDYEDFAFDGLRSPVVSGPRPHVLYLDWEFQNLHRRVEQFLERSHGAVPRDGVWLESMGKVADTWAYRVPQRTTDTLAAVVALTNDLLPDFIKGELRAHVTAASMWEGLPKVILEFLERGATQCADVVELAGAGAARWLAASLQMSLHLLDDQPDLRTLRSTHRHLLSGHVVLLDEPEAHLHPSAVRSVTRWCKRMTSLGMTLLVATHHEEFLREADAGATLVHVTRDADLVSRASSPLK